MNRRRCFHIVAALGAVGLAAWFSPEASAQQFDRTTASSGAQGDSVTFQEGLSAYLEPNVPNPFSGSTQINYVLSEATPVILKVYDFFYGEVATLVDGTTQQPGRYSEVFRPSLNGIIASGMYFYELRTNRGIDRRRMYFVK